MDAHDSPLCLCCRVMQLAMLHEQTRAAVVSLQFGHIFDTAANFFAVKWFSLHREYLLSNYC